MKIPRAPHEPGKGAFWAIDEKYVDVFEKGLQLKRRLRGTRSDSETQIPRTARKRSSRDRTVKKGSVGQIASPEPHDDVMRVPSSTNLVTDWPTVDTSDTSGNVGSPYESYSDESLFTGRTEATFEYSPPAGSAEIDFEWGQYAEFLEALPSTLEHNPFVADELVPNLITPDQELAGDWEGIMPSF